MWAGVLRQFILSLTSTFSRLAWDGLTLRAQLARGRSSWLRAEARLRPSGARRFRVV